MLLTLQTQEEDGGVLVAMLFGWELGVALVTETNKVCRESEDAMHSLQTMM